MFAITIIMTTVAVIVRRITIEKTVCGITTANDIECIGTFDLAVLQSDSQFLCKTLSFGIDLFVIDAGRLSTCTSIYFFVIDEAELKNSCSIVERAKAMSARAKARPIFSVAVT